MDQLDLLNELHLMQSQMNTMFKVLVPKKGDKDLLDSYNKAVESRKKKSDDDDTPTFSKKYLASQEKTNDYLERLIKTTQQVQFNRENTTLNPFHDERKFSVNPLNIMKNMGSFLEKDGNKGLTSALLKLPAGLLNFGKDIISKKEIKRIDSGRKELGINKEILEARTQQLADLKKKHKEENPSGVENPDHIKKERDLELKIINQKHLVKATASELTKNSEKLQNKNDLALNKNKFKGISEDDVFDIRQNNRRKMEESLLEDLEPKPKKKRKKKNKNVDSENDTNPLTIDTQKVTRSGLVDRYGNPISSSDSSNGVSNNKQSRLEGFENAIKPLKGMKGDTSIDKPESSSILNQRVNIGPVASNKFGDVVGGIYYRLGVIIENSGKNKETKEEDSGGIGGMLKTLAGVAAMLITKSLPLLKTAFSMLVKSGLALGKVFSKIVKLGGGAASKVFSWFKSFGSKTSRIKTIPGLESASDYISGGAKRGGILSKIGGVAGNVAKTIGLKGLGAAGMTSGMGITGAGLMGALGTAIIPGLVLGAGLSQLGKHVGTRGSKEYFDPEKKLERERQESKDATQKYILERYGKKGIKSSTLPLVSKEQPENIKNTFPVREQISPTLQTESEVSRAKNAADQTKILENAVYLGMKRYSIEDLQNNEPTRAQIHADANLNAGNS